MKWFNTEIHFQVPQTFDDGFFLKNKSSCSQTKWKKNDAHAKLQPAHLLLTSKAGERRTANFILSVSNLLLHKLSNSLAKVPQVTDKSRFKRILFVSLENFAFSKTFAVPSSFLHRDSFFNDEFCSTLSALKKSNQSNKRFSEKSHL